MHLVAGGLRHGRANLGFVERRDAGAVTAEPPGSRDRDHRDPGARKQERTAGRPLASRSATSASSWANAPSRGTATSAPQPAQRTAPPAWAAVTTIVREQWQGRM
ncbi:MAG: hypothetical protein ACKOSQ_01295 [Planctomycetaceae bacterium]